MQSRSDIDRAIDRRQVRIGSHLVTNRTVIGINAYQHHGIYVGRRMVAHYSSWVEAFNKGDIKTESIEFFANETQNVGIVEYNAPIEKECILRRIEEMRTRQPPYNIMHRNCEHFAIYCRTGEWRSDQIGRLVWSGVIRHLITLNM